MSVFGEVLGKVFGTNNAVDNILDKEKGLLVRAGTWIGNLNLTPEEILENNLLGRNWGLKKLEALAPFKIMQRIMVTIIMVQWAILLNVIVIAICFKSTMVLDHLLLFARLHQMIYS